ncbi:MAG: transglycosylase SLT domain-containing protein [Bacteroidales bacterium]|nr:transglycosylase SLT domain-containing protein [Bacteroidales bacterium]
MSPRLRSVLIIAGVTVVLLLLPVRDKRPAPELPPQDTLRCVVPSGIHKELVLKYAEDQSLTMIVEKGAASLDSLTAGVIDLAVVPDTMAVPDGAVGSKHFLQNTVWVVRGSETEALRRINHWMTEIGSSRLYRKMEKGKLERLDVISQYDGLIKKHAAAIGWDWRLVAAIIYNESRFHNEASSHKGAQGLMQILSSKYTYEEVSDPDRNLEIGTRYLKRLKKMYSRNAADDMESLKFALAAYNVGEGKIQRCIDEAREKGLDASRWATVSTMLPEGHHTKKYVEDVLDTYRDYSRFFPAK